MGWNLANLFESVVDVIPDRTALVVPNAVGGPVQRTYAELDERANRLAHALGDRGIGAGDKVGIYAFNSPEWVEAQWACWKLRAVPINVNYRYVENELGYLFDNADLAALVHGAEFSPRIAAVRASCPLLKVCLAFDDGSGTDISVCDAVDYEQALAAASPERGFDERTGDELYMLYTGGTTGMPKGVMWRQEDFFKATIGPVMTTMTPPLVEESEVPERALERTPSVSFPVAPLMHGAAQWTSIVAALGGDTLALSGAHHFDPVEVWRIAAETGTVTMSLVGDAQARPLADALETLPDDIDLSSLFLVSSGGAILSPSVKQHLSTLLPNIIIFDAIGASETGFQGTGSSSDAQGRPQFMFGDHTLVIDDEGNPTTPGDGQVGRLVRRGHIPLGYYKDEVKTAETFPTINGERWVVPGDMAVAEADGSITLLGRGSVSINSGGEKIFPEEVELVLKGHPDVFDAVVVGVPDERWGERVAAVIAPRGDARPTVEELRDHAKAMLASYKLPREVHFVDEMVRSPSGKADYRWAKGVARDDESSS
ncbi:MAG: acyl-CoA synthetase [Acidimicrobiales bacterium]|jgi:acyl-CoA synthetase (AMP-forming)/AMP-acid ligase II|nr:acyl-CoA synthetase [Acidimicrobiales bacterium]